MTSKQLNFFMMPDDLVGFENEFSNFGALFIRQPLPSPTLTFKDSIGYSNGEFAKIFLTTQTFTNKVIIRKIENKKYYLIDDLRSPVIEFSRGVKNEGIVQRSRLYFTKEYYNENGHLVEKDRRFTTWASSLLKAIKTHFLVQYGGEKNILYTSTMIEWMEKTGWEMNTAGTAICSKRLVDESE